MDRSTALVWRKSSYSGGGSENCVEVASTPSGIAIRDSKMPGLHLQFTSQEWLTFLGTVKNSTRKTFTP
ncbi:DUF397 domain-containing protein [Thermopolyspora sp. NPDC052614]|uniref:DUF397 domain-containing protein n=1 Tax=Thermopolyspora sp. NPDC052614 TaxID=3155682 RepID=UPI00341F3D28